MADIIQDADGNIRRCGLMLGTHHPGARLYESVNQVWDTADILTAIRDPNRKLGRKLFGPEWILDQKSHGSCAGHGKAGAYQRARHLRGIQDKMLFSGAYPYSKCNGGQDEGSVLADEMEAGIKFGNAPLSLVTWDMIYPRLQPAGVDAMAAQHLDYESFAVGTKEGLYTALAKGEMVVVAVHVASQYMRFGSDGVAGVDNGPGNHCVMCDDLIEPNGKSVSSLDDLIFDQPGSWGSSQGVQGRWMLRWGHFAQTFPNHAFYAIPSTVEAD